MRIATLLKSIIDLSAISISKSQQKIFENNPPVLNPVDGNALELALSIKDSQKAEVLAISLDDSIDSKILHQALAMGVDQAYSVSGGGIFIDDPFCKSIILAEAIKKIGGFDLIIAGSGSITGNGGQTGPRIAQYLNLPHITQVKNLQFKGNIIVAEKLIDKNRVITQEENWPCFLTTAIGINKPRLPNALAIIKASKKDIIKLNISEFNLETNLRKVTEIVRMYML